MKYIDLFSYAILLNIACVQITLAQVTTVASQNTMIKPNHNYGLTNPLHDENSPMTYNPSEIDTKGAAFSINYTNQGGTSFDGYPNGGIGGFKVGGVYYPGNRSVCGMPIQIQDLAHNLRINWKTSQTNANDADDKWWATINVIFDSGSETSAPVATNRDYDLVIQHISYQQDSFTDLANPGGRYWYFARNTDNSIKPFVLYINGVAYSWAVRYKFFDYPEGHPKEHKNNKVHIKFIPIDNENPIPNLDHSLKLFIDCTKDYIQYLTLTQDELNLANEKVAEPSLWIKSIQAGYEVYEGSSTLANDYFFMTIDDIAPNSLTNLVAIEQNEGVSLNWDASADEAFDTYTVYRSTNNEAYTELVSGLRTNNYVDNTVGTGLYSYYVTALDRSFNESGQSNVEDVTIDVLSVDEEEVTNSIIVYSNPTSDIVNLLIENDKLLNGRIQVFDFMGRFVKSLPIVDKYIQFKLNEASGVYFLKIFRKDNVITKRVLKL
ncbi:T9SS type A sorting domain-containing protein [Pseudofulvibacter geojedonensis]|uniref:T9SS type A sorting domain-containing protein n=1 Tax=Pseudofulvibacter geojedonensis TaxID=1123758 RepID=A0ABW3HZE1_9FLAO